MDWNASLGWILVVAFGLGALHALEPGHGKSIMGACLVAGSGNPVERHRRRLGASLLVNFNGLRFLRVNAAA
jgi:hypothetical protein